MMGGFDRQISCRGDLNEGPRTDTGDQGGGHMTHYYTPSATQRVRYHGGAGSRQADSTSSVNKELKCGQAGHMERQLPADFLRRRIARLRLVDGGLRLRAMGVLARRVAIVARLP